jgi:hypothetical protein
MEKNGVGFARVGAPKKNDVRVFNFAVGACAPARSENRRQTGDARGMSRSVTTIDVVTADDRANEFLRGVVEFVGGLGAAEHAKRTRSVLANLFADATRDTIESLFPRR